MPVRMLLALSPLLVWATAGAADLPVTDPKVPSPTAEAARRWVLAAFEAQPADFYGERFTGTEAARMLATVQRGEHLRAGVGWYDPGHRRHDWTWFTNRYDANRNGRISPVELGAGTDLFAALDRDRDGAVTAEDFDWSERAPWVRQTGQSLRFFRAIDMNGDGKIGEKEMTEYFQKLAGEKGHLKPNDLRDALLDAMAKETGKGPSKPKRVTTPVWLRSLLEGDLGSPVEGPRVGQTAPDFTLTTQDGKRQITLSSFRDKRPVVLAFGSIT